jgi:catechol 2,3-dioxygenase-like lactoylglutathione lyase family enzyme
MAVANPNTPLRLSFAHCPPGGRSTLHARGTARARVRPLRFHYRSSLALVWCFVTACTAAIVVAPDQGSMRPYLLAISVKDLDASVDWYERALDFKVVSKRDFPDFSLRLAMLTRQGFELELVEHHRSQSPAQLIPDFENPALLQGYGQIGFLVTDAKALQHTLHARGVTIKMPLRVDETDHSLSFIALDNNGNWLEFTERVHGQ